MFTQNLNKVWQFFSYFGDFAYWLGFYISFFIIYPLLDRADRKKVRWILEFLGPVVIFCYALVQLLKLYFKIPRPCFGEPFCPSSYSFPSGHSAIAFTWFSVVIFYLRKRIYWLLLAIPILVSISRIMLGVHTFYDVFFGSLLGIFVGAVLTYFYKNSSKIFKQLEKHKFLVRKLIHIFGLVFLLIYFLYGKSILEKILFASIIFYLLIEMLRLRKIRIRLFHDAIESCAEREEKILGFFSPLFYMVGLFLSLLFFPEKVFLIASVSLIVGDFFSGFIGKELGRIKLPYNKKKSLEGFLSFFLSTFLAYCTFLSLKESVVFALIFSFLESFLNEADNFILPISSSLLSYLYFLIF